MTRLFRFSFFFAACALLFFAASASAATPQAPPSLVVETRIQHEFGAADGYWASLMNVTIQPSADDPDQINGSFAYRVWARPVNGTWSEVFYSGVFQPRPGWIGFKAVSPTDVLTNRTWEWAVTANNTTMTPPNGLSSLSCIVSVDMRVRPLDHVLGGHGQCGNAALAPPPGLTAFVNQAAGDSTNTASVELRWRVSASDPNQTVGSLNYRIFRTFEGCSLTTQRGVLPPGYCADHGLDTVTSTDAAGIRYNLVETGNVAMQFRFNVRAEDALTRQRSNLTCTVAVHTGNLYQTQTCGNLAATGSSLAPGAPSFPFLDVPATAAALQIEVAPFGYLLAAVLLMVTAYGGWTYAGSAGALGTGILGLGAVAFLNLIPTWLLIVVFMGGAMLLVFSLSRGGGGE